VICGLQPPLTRRVWSWLSASARRCHLSQTRGSLRQPRVPRDRTYGDRPSRNPEHSASSYCGRDDLEGQIYWRQGRLGVASTGDASRPQSAQVGLANLRQTRVASSWPRGRSVAGPGLSCWFGVEPPAGIEPATPSLPFVLPRTCSRRPQVNGTGVTASDRENPGLTDAYGTRVARGCVVPGGSGCLIRVHACPSQGAACRARW